MGVMEQAANALRELGTFEGRGWKASAWHSSRVNSSVALVFVVSAVRHSLGVVFELC